MIKLLQGDCLELLKALPACSVDSIVTDPPYHLSAGKQGASGFMGQAWDGGDVAFRVETWREALRVLKPGGFLLAFSGTRTYHRMATAIEGAGFELRDMVAWIYAQGFPKGTDKAKIPEEWAGWNTALKPALEPICMARKPMEGTLADNLRKWGTGALWIDGCRIPLDGEVIEATGKGALPVRHDAHTPREAATIAERPEDLGRWPANVCHDGSDEVLAAFPDAPGAQAPVTGGEPSSSTASVYGRFNRAASDRTGEASAGSANRGVVGFNLKPGVRRPPASAARFFFCPKANRRDRNEGTEGLPARELNWSSGEANPGSFQSENTDRSATNHHSTVKPTELCRWLLRLVTPPGGTSLDMFAGSSSFGKAAVLEGFSWIGMELDRDENGEPLGYIAIGEARIAHAQAQRARELQEAALRAAEPRNLDLFEELAP